MSNTESRIPCSIETRKRLKAAKRGGQTYEELLKAMLEQYDPQITSVGALPQTSSDQSGRSLR